LLEGDETTLVLSYHDPHSSEEPNTLPPLERVARTTQFWEGKAAALEYDGPWREEVVRAYLALHLLTYLPSGGIVAAPTTSLPEELGGVRNWDYRYTWLRDATFTIDALMSLGHLDEAREFFAWLSRICTECATRDRLQIMFRVDGSPDLAEQELPHLEGYRGSRPVRIGNGAAGQAQHDIYGEVLASAALMVGHDSGSVEAHWDVLHTLARLACTRWREPDSGIWEIRGGPYHFVYSKVMSWVALDRAVKLAEALGRSGPDVELWRATAEEVKREVLERGWNPRKQSFVQHYDSEAADASNLLIPLMDFLPPDDPRVVSTVECIRRELSHGPFVHRYRTSEIDDGLPGSEGAFTLCSFWMVQVLARMGRVQEARQLFQELLKCANHVGLYSEMVDPKTGQFLGNFPQAFTHIGLILAARECALGE
jgi:GH15 family glucan-1,4-alpha-glucosidase